MSLKSRSRNPATSLRLLPKHNGSSLEIGLSSPDQNMSSRERCSASTDSGRPKQQSKRWNNKKTTLLSILALAPMATAQNCVPISGSKQCPAFESASISTTDPTVVGYFPFLRFVSDTASFDQQLRTYVETTHVQNTYQVRLGCGDINLTNTTDFYARFATTVICNSIIQNSAIPCNMSPAQARPLCADACAQHAQSEAIIISDRTLCSSAGIEADEQIRADFTTCALPNTSLTGICVQAADNEVENCGFGNSTLGLCGYCASGGQNSTDTCCYNSNAQQRCRGVVLPTITGLMTFSTVTPTASPTSSPSAAANSDSSLSAGAIAGIVIGSVVALALLIGLIILLIMCLRRRSGSQHGSVFNQPSPKRGNTGMAYNPVGATTTPAGYEVLPGGRIARMSALEGHSGGSPPRGELAAGGAAAGYAAGRRRGHDASSSDEYSPVSNHGGILRPPPTAGRRHGSLSSNSALGIEDAHSRHSGSGGDMSSPQALASQQSEQLSHFKDYYSQEQIHPGDKVATLWAYQPRAGDEFALERGDMLKVVGIWDDGWATGVLIEENAEDWDAKHNPQRDSGVSSGSVRRDTSPAGSGEIKAFPLVCVCLPDYWRRTIEGGDTSTETGSSTQPRPNP